MTSANKSYVTRALGLDPTVEVTMGEYPVELGDFYLLCSDGLTDMLDEADIYMTINRFKDDPDMIVKQLVVRANERGGNDNISVIGILVTDAFPAHADLATRFRNWLKRFRKGE
jgi:protein phosphatase